MCRKNTEIDVLWSRGVDSSALGRGRWLPILPDLITDGDVHWHLETQSSEPSAPSSGASSFKTITIRLAMAWVPQKLLGGTLTSHSS